MFFVSDIFWFITAGDKPFGSKVFSNALGVARVSFAPADLMEKLRYKFET